MVFKWDLRERDFKEIIIKRDEYNPLHHSYLSYRIWKKELKELEAKQREKRKQAVNEPVQEGEPKAKKS